MSPENCQMSPEFAKCRQKNDLKKGQNWYLKYHFSGDIWQISGDILAIFWRHFGHLPNGITFCTFDKKCALKEG
jgi:hypothetical protein